MKNRNTQRGFTQCCFPKGFTLIELLVVVLIIGILAAVAVPQYQFAVAKSRYASTKISGINIGQSASRFLLEHGVPPQRYDELDIVVPGIESSSRAQFNGITCVLGHYQNSMAIVDCYFTLQSRPLTFRVHVHQNGYIKTTCVAYKDQEMGNKICAAETGEEGSVSAAGDQIGYNY